jgi:hypothetical protein
MVNFYRAYRRFERFILKNTNLNEPPDDRKRYSDMARFPRKVQQQSLEETKEGELDSLKHLPVIDLDDPDGEFPLPVVERAKIAFEEDYGGIEVRDLVSILGVAKDKSIKEDFLLYSVGERNGKHENINMIRLSSLIEYQKRQS